MTIFKKRWGNHMSDKEITFGKAAAVTGGAGFAQVAEHAQNFTLADIASAITIIYTVFLFYFMISDRLEKRRNKKIRSQVRHDED